MIPIRVIDWSRSAASSSSTGFRSGQSFHRYLNPERDIPAEAFAVHGLSEEFLKDKPPFSEIAEELLAFVGEARLVIHNAAFDIGFLNAELERVGRKPLSRDRLVDTLLLARRKFPGGQNRLDDLCARYGIDNSRRTKHGALLDAELLAEVYLELIEARQSPARSGGGGGRKCWDCGRRGAATTHSVGACHFGARARRASGVYRNARTKGDLAGLRARRGLERAAGDQAEPDPASADCGWVCPTFCR